MHNGIAFDLPVLNRNWGTKYSLKNVLCDTLVLSRLLNPSLEGGHSLSEWGKRLGNYKGDFTDFDAGWSQEMQDYCIQDVNVTEQLYQRLMADKEKLGFSDESVEIEHRVQAIINKQERNGFKLNELKTTTLLAELKDKLAAIETELQSIFQPIVEERVSEKTGKRLKDKVTVFNPGSRQQIADRLQKLGWKPEKFTETGHPIVDETVLSKSTIPEALKMAEYLLLQKRIAQISSWLEHLGDDGRVHGRVITNGAVTGRMTHRNPNMAQIPSVGSPYGPECREVWCVEAGNKLVGIDASGLELRMLAHYMKDQEYVKTVTEGSSKDGSDVHTKNQKAAGLQTRDQAKTFIYAFLYGAGPEKIGSIVGGGSKEGKKLISSFLKETPALQKLREKVSEVSASGYLPGLDGRKLLVRSEHAALNTLLQGAGAIVMKKALILLEQKLKYNKITHKFVVNVHDEWQIETTERDADTVGKLGVWAIEEAGRHFNMRCPLTGEYRVGDNWRDTH
jgi:DNA polymerase-1